MEIGAREFKSHVGAYLDRVEGGEAIIVTRHGKPVAQIMPIGVDRGIVALVASGRARWSGRKPEMPRTVTMKKGDRLISDYVLEGRR